MSTAVARDKGLSSTTNIDGLPTANSAQTGTSTDEVEASLGALFRREMMVKPAVNVPRWLTAQTSNGPLRVLGFVVNRESPHYAGKIAPDLAAEIVSTAAGHWGSCAEYLRETVAHLEELGIRDRNLWRLQALVAQRIEARSNATA